MILTLPGRVAADEKSPHISWLFPAGGQRGKTIGVAVGGAELAGARAVIITGTGVEGKVTEVPNDKIKTLKLSIAISANAELCQRDVCIQTPAGVSNWFHFFVGQLPEVNEVEPNDDLAKAQVLPALPVLVNGQINPQAGQPSDRDCFRFEAKAGQTLVFTVDARAILPYMSDAVPGWLQAILSLYDANGKELAYADGFRYQQDTVLIYKVPAEGQYVVALRDSLYRGREDFVYRLSIAPDRPDFQLRLAADLPQRLAAGETAAATVATLRQGGYDGEIHLTLQDMPKGFVMRGGAISRKQGWEDGNETRLTITAPADAALGILAPRIVGTALIDGKDVVRPLAPTVTVKQAFSINHLVPMPEYLLNIAAKQPGFLLTTDVAADGILEVAPGGEVKIPLKALRDANAGAAISLALDQPPWGFSAKSEMIEAGKNECAMSLKVDKGAHPGRLQSVVFSGTMDTGKEKLVRYAPAVLVKVAAPGTPAVAAAAPPAKAAVAPPVPVLAAKAPPPAAKAVPAPPAAKLAAPAGPYRGIPHGGKAWPIPGKIEVEDFDDGGEGVAYHTNNPCKKGGVHRPEEVVSMMVNAGRSVLNDTKPGNWLNYTVEVAATGTYDFVTCMATAGDENTIHFELDGVDVTGPIQGINKNWDNFVDVTKTAVRLTAGRHVLRLIEDTGGYDIDYLKVIGPTAK
jgi:hypothetical protein